MATSLRRDLHAKALHDRYSRDGPKSSPPFYSARILERTAAEERGREDALAILSDLLPSGALHAAKMSLPGKLLRRIAWNVPAVRETLFPGAHAKHDADLCAYLDEELRARQEILRHVTDLEKETGITCEFIHHKAIRMEAGLWPLGLERDDAEEMIRGLAACYL